MATPTVSVIVPVYNAEAFLPRAIRSVTEQPYREVELILVDDGSSDGSKALCEEHAAADRRIRVLAQANRGPSAARNTGLRHATGTYVFFLDADDFIAPRTIELMVAEFERLPVDMVMSNFCKLTPPGDVVRQRVSFTSANDPYSGEGRILDQPAIGEYLRNFLNHPSNHLMSYCWARLYKLSLIRQHDLVAHEDMRLFEDYVFNLRYLRHAGGIAFVNQPLYTYVMHAEHVSASMAVLDASSLLHDMEVFLRETRAFAQQLGGRTDVSEIEREARHALVHYAIIFLVRSCRQLTRENRGAIAREIKALISAPMLRDSLPCYRPFPGNSRAVPFMMRLGLVAPLMETCRYKAHRRYGKRKGG